tara:strand:+ start:276 stop:461 length:186 start_codon:yes stop_codon:yes gene_type:complete
MKYKSNLEIYTIIAVMLIMYLGFIGYSLHTQFKTLGELEKQFIELQNIEIPKVSEDIEIRG